MLALRALTLAGRFWLRLHGIRPGRGGWVHGLPVLRLAKGSHVHIGDEVTLNSLSRTNPLAPSRRLAIVTNTEHARISIGNNSGLSNCILSCFASITIGSNCMLGAECLVIDSDFHELPLGSGKPIKTAPVEIGSNVFIGTRTIILKGVRIGDSAVIGAGSVVTSEIPAGCIAAGNPARVIRTRQVNQHPLPG